MNLDTYIQKKSQEVARRIKLSRPFAVITELNTLKEIYPKNYSEDRKLLGCAYLKDYVVFINKASKRHTRIEELDDTICEEILHLKYPHKTEYEVKRLKLKYL